MTLIALCGTIEGVVHIPLREPRVRYVVLSDIHGNLAALRAVLGDIGSVDAVWCLGDVVGYGPNPNECVELVRQHAAICLAGNHDWAAAAKMDLDAFNPDAVRAITWTRQQLTGENLGFLAGLPSMLRQGADDAGPRQPLETPSGSTFCRSARLTRTSHALTPPVAWWDTPTVQQSFARRRAQSSSFSRAATGL